MNYVLELFKTTFKGAVWFVTALVSGSIWYANVENFKASALERLDKTEKRITYIDEKVNDKLDKALEKLNNIEGRLGIKRD